MPSPFPGMDPFLENSTRWPGFHLRLIADIQSTLNRMLRPKYYVGVENRVYVSDETDPGRSAIIPDARIAAYRERASEPFLPPNGETTTLEVATPVELITLIDDEICERRLEIVDVDSEKVITIIEILSPTNKIAGAKGRASYVEKRDEVMHSDTHFVEIDLLRAGLPFVNRDTLPLCDYLVHVSRYPDRPKGKVWPIRLRQRLPYIPIPLLAADPDVRLDLQQILTGAYDNGSYDMAINYTRLPIPPLANDDAAWADALLREKGLRP